MRTNRIHSALLRIYSPDFRDRYGDEILATLEADDISRSRRGRIASDVDLARNGVAQRFGADVVTDIEGGARWVGLVALILCIAWSTVSLTSSIKWLDFAPTSRRIALLWTIVLLASIGRLLLPRRWARLAWLIGILTVLWSTIVAATVRNMWMNETTLGSVAYLLRWQTAAVSVLLLLGAAAPSATKRSNIFGTLSGLAIGVLLTVRFHSYASFSRATTYTLESDDTYIRYPLIDQPFGSSVDRGSFVDLTRVDLLPNFGWLCLVGLLALASFGLLRPKAAVAAIAAGAIALIAVLGFDALPAVPTALRIIVPLAVLLESVIVLTSRWRRDDLAAAAF